LYIHQQASVFWYNELIWKKNNNTAAKSSLFLSLGVGDGGWFFLLKKMQATISCQFVGQNKVRNK